MHRWILPKLGFVLGLRFALVRRSRLYTVKFAVTVTVKERYAKQ